MPETILVTGASGKLGGLVIHHLLETQKLSADRIVAATRDPSKLENLAARGVATRKADFDDPAGLADAFAGVDTVLIISTDALDGAGTRLRQHRAAVAAAAKAGVKRLAYTSLPDADSSHVSFAPDHHHTEEAIKETGLPHLIFRNCWYQENLFMRLPQALGSGQLYSAEGEGRIAYVARNDIAEAIAAALANPPAGSVTYTLTGGEALTVTEMAGLASEIIGRPITVVPVTDEQLAGGMKAAGVPEAVIPTLVSFDIAAREGDLSEVTGEIEALIGRKPASLREFLVQNKMALAG